LARSESLDPGVVSVSERRKIWIAVTPALSTGAELRMIMVAGSGFRSTVGCKNRMPGYLPIIAVSLAAIGSTIGCRPYPSGPQMQSASDVLHEQVAAGRTPAVQYRFVGPDSVLFRYDEGMADVASGISVSNTTTYNGFSVTKTFTAVAILQLSERGDLDLDRPAADYLPDFPYSGQITVRHLLTHTAGIPNPIPLSWIHLEDEHGTFDRDEFFGSVFAKHPKVRASPNTRFGYSNLGYVLLGQIIEKVSDVSYEQYVKENILVPAGLSSADLGFSRYGTDQATGYHRRGSFSYLLLGVFLKRSKYMEPAEHGWHKFRPYYVNGASYGGLIGTADGFARYVQVLLDPASDLLSDESRRMLFTENLLSNGKPSGMSLSWFTGELRGNAYAAHAGGGGGYYSEIRIYPEVRLGSVIVFNRTGLRDERFLDRVDPYLIDARAEVRAL
jgi:D-alanyl-D-alanine carboxypeptidase